MAGEEITFCYWLLEQLPDRIVYSLYKKAQIQLPIVRLQGREGLAYTLEMLMSIVEHNYCFLNDNGSLRVFKKEGAKNEKATDDNKV